MGKTNGGGDASSAFKSIIKKSGFDSTAKNTKAAAGLKPVHNALLRSKTNSLNAMGGKF
jgi:hypothetical protein